MLDEIMEYEQYTFPVRESFLSAIESGSIDTFYTRLQYRTIGNGFSGLARAMTIIARGSLFDSGKRERKTREVSLSWKRYKRAEATLKSWTGADRNGFQGMAYGWLPSYIGFGLLAERMINAKREEDGKIRDARMRRKIYAEIAEKIEALFEEGYLTPGKIQSDKKLATKAFLDNEKNRRALLEEKLPKTDKDDDLAHAICQARKLLAEEETQQCFLGSKFLRKLRSYDYPILDRSMNTDWSKNGRSIGDENQITYDRVIADAMEAGPLKRRVIIAKKELFENVRKESEKKGLIRLTSKDKDHVLKCVAAVLLQRASVREPYDTLFPVPDFVFVTKADLQNWMQISERALNTMLDSMVYCPGDNRTPLFETDSHTGLQLMSVSDEWIHTYDIRLLDKDSREYNRFLKKKTDSGYVLYEEVREKNALFSISE